MYTDDAIVRLSEVSAGYSGMPVRCREAGFYVLGLACKETLMKLQLKSEKPEQTSAGIPWVS